MNNAEWAERIGEDLTYSGEYNAIREMDSIGEHTSGEYPDFSEYISARNQGRVSGDFRKRVVIVSNNPIANYTFVTDYPSYNGNIEQTVKRNRSAEAI